MAEDLREHLDIELHQFDKELYEMHSLHPAQGKSTVTETISTPVVTPEIQPHNEMATKPEAVTPQPEEEKPEIEPRRPDYSEGVQLSLLDLWGMTEEVRKKEAPAKKKKTAKKESTARRAIPKPKPPVTAVPPVESVKPVIESKDTKPKNVGKQSDPEDIYATLDWDTNPPINGFYEMMMDLTPERRKELRRLAAQHQEKQRVDGTAVKAALAIDMPEKEATKRPEAQTEVATVPVTDNNASETTTSLFPEFETEKPKEEPLDLSPRPFNGLLEPHYRDGSMVLDASRNLDAICSKVMCKAGIRQGKNERKSLHLFRHNVATTLLQGGVQQPVISATLGHASPDSLDRYLSAEFKRLKECSLSIEHFPIRKGVFDV